MSRLRSRQALVVAVVAVGLALTMSARATGRDTPQWKTCKTDLDCDACDRCVDGRCPVTSRSNPECFCDAECDFLKLGSCVASTEKPLCGGYCLKGGKPSPLTCSTGNDFVTLESLATPITDNLTGATVINEGTIIVVGFQ